MTKQEIYEVLVDTFKTDYGIDITSFPPETPVSKLRELSPKLDSLEFLQFIFSVEDKTGIELPEGGTTPNTLGDILDAFDNAANG